jgi:cellulose synthase/poly-beta-1,6-N-acetylglucosamine synthase-like glycosyltransferase
VLGQTYPHLEVLVVDGGSTDRTRSLVAQYAEVDPRVRLIDNPRRIPPAALNEAVLAMRSDVLVRIDGHSTVAPDYVERAVRHLRDGEWGGVGGRKDGVGLTVQGRAIAAVLGSRFGVGNSTYHHGTDVQVVDHVPFGAYRREVVEKLGGWNESLPTNEDYEFDHRLREAGFELLFDPAMVIAWEVRPSVRAFWRQYRRYGRGKASVVRLHPGSVKARHLAAPALVVLLAAGVVALPWKPRWAVAAALPYLGALTVASATTVGRVDRQARRWVPAAFAAMHLGWGLGFWEGMAGAFAHHQDESVR